MSALRLVDFGGRRLRHETADEEADAREKAVASTAWFSREPINCVMTSDPVAIPRSVLREWFGQNSEHLIGQKLELINVHSGTRKSITLMFEEHQVKVFVDATYDAMMHEEDIMERIEFAELHLRFRSAGMTIFTIPRLLAPSFVSSILHLGTGTCHAPLDALLDMMNELK